MLKQGISKVQFLRQYGKVLVLNSCDRQLGTRLFLTLYIRVALCCRCLLYIVSVAQHQTVLRVLSFEYSHDRQLGKRLFLTLYIRVGVSCRCLFYRVSGLAQARSSLYISIFDLYIARSAPSCTRTIFLLSDDLQKLHTRCQ